jgi:adenylate cyclase
MSWQKAIPILTFYIVCVTLSCAQDKTDSLITVLKTAPQDTNRVNILLDISKNLYDTRPTEAIDYANQAKALSATLNYPKGTGYALKYIGLAYYAQGNYPEVLTQWEESLKVFTNSNDKLGEANILNNIGSVYYVKGDYVRALDNFLRSMKISEELKDTLRIATAYLNIGAVYENNPTTYDKALQNYELALKMSESIGDLEAIGTAAGNLGEINLQTNNLPEALKNFQKSEAAYKKAADMANLSLTLGLIGKVYSLQGNYAQAIKVQEEAIAMARQYGYKLEIVRSLIHLGNTYKASLRNDLAIKTYLEAEVTAKEIEAKFELKNIYEGLATTYSAKSDFRNAYRYHENLSSVKDSLFTDDNAKKLDLMQFEFDLEKKESQIALLTKDKEVKDLELEKQKLTRNGLIVGIGLLIFVAFFLYRNYKEKSKSNKMLAEQNWEILQQKEEIEAQRDDIDDQKKEIENLMLNILPLEVAQELRKTGQATPQYYESVTVLFTDFKEFTRMAEFMSAQELVAELNQCFIAFDEIIGEFGLEKIKTIGDAYMCACGIPTPIEDHATRTVRAALAIQAYIAKENANRKAKGEQLWELRIGIHTGPVIAGVVGRKKFAYDIWGSTVNVANRLESGGVEGRVNISEATYHLIKHEFVCSHRGKITAKSLGEVDMYFVDHEIKS